MAHTTDNTTTTNLFGGKDNDKAKRYNHGTRNTKAILTVRAQSSEEVEEAADIMDDTGAVIVDEGSAGYSSSSNRVEGSSLRSRSSIIDRHVNDSYRLRGEE